MSKRRLRLDRTLGPLVVRWIETQLVHGPGDVQGQRVELDDEQVELVLRCYEIDDKGRRVIRRGVYSRAKGRAKSETGAFFACAEGLGPVRFAGWDHDGRPLGRPVTSPYIPCIATEEGQADNTYAAIEFMLREGAVSATPGLDIGLTRTYLPGGGKIQSVTAKASSKDGGKETFAIFDETHLYITPELHRLHATIRRNLTKRKIAEPWSLETSTMYAPDENSVAEMSHRYWEAIQSGAITDTTFLFDHRQGPSAFDFDDDDLLRAALREAYGAAAEWMDIERLLAEARDPDTDRNDFIRYFLNVPTERTEGKWISDEAWRACHGATEIPALAPLAVGVDAAHTRDTTACVWSWLNPETGRVVQRSRVWSCVKDKPHDVFVPGGRLDNDLVVAYIREELIPAYSIEIVLGDERYFTDQLHELSEEDGILVVEVSQGSAHMNAAWDEFYGHVHAGPHPRIEHNGNQIYAAHIRNAVGIRTERGWKVSKRTTVAPIDAGAAGSMSAYGAVHLAELAPAPAHNSWRPL